MVFESLGRVAYIFVLVLAQLYVQGETVLFIPISLFVVMIALQIGEFGLDFYGKSVARSDASRWKEFWLIIGVGTFLGSFLGMLYLDNHSEYFWSLWAMYILHIVLGLLYSCPPLHLNIHGGGSIIMFLMHGFISVELVTLGLNIGWSMQSILECIPSHLLLQASLVVRELTTLKEDTKVTTTAGLLGRHDSFRFVVLMHFFAFLFVAVDFAALSYTRGLPIVLALWSLPLLYHLRHFRLAGLWKSYYRLFLTFTLTYAVGMMLESPRFLDDLKTKG